jgi:hypothetical protein
MKRRATRKRAAKPIDLVAERIAWIDRVTRAIDSPPGPMFPFDLDVRTFRSKMQLLRDGVVLGANLARFKG